MFSTKSNKDNKHNKEEKKKSQQETTIVETKHDVRGYNQKRRVKNYDVISFKERSNVLNNQKA